MESQRNESGKQMEGQSFGAALDRLVADAHADGKQIEGAWVVSSDDGSEWEVLITSVERR